jgi:hypothetical protein
VTTTAVFRYDGRDDHGLSIRRWTGTRVEVREEEPDEFGVYGIRFEDGSRWGAYTYELTEWDYDDTNDGWRHHHHG